MHRPHSSCIIHTHYPPCAAATAAAAAGLNSRNGVLQGVLADVDLLQRITQASREMVRNWVMERTGIDGRIGSNVLPSLLKWTGFYQDPITRALQVRANLPACTYVGRE
jgi:hypothetical protein